MLLFSKLNNFCFGNFDPEFFLLDTVGPVIIEFFRAEIGQFKISSDKFANDSVRLKKVQPKFAVAIHKAILNIKKSTAIQSKST